MPRNSSPRKKYVPKSTDSVLIRFSDEDERRFQMAPHAQLFNLRDGRGDQEAWDTLEWRIRWCEHLARKLNLPEVVAQTKVGIERLMQIHERYTAENRYDATTEEASTLGDCLNLADELQLQSTRRELRDSLNTAMAAMKKAPLAGRTNSLLF